MARRQRERLAEKTVERQFLYELEKDFELAPATSRAVLETAQQVLLLSSENGEIREGQMRVTAVSVDEPSGKPLSAMKKVGVNAATDITGFGVKGHAANIASLSCVDVTIDRLPVIAGTLELAEFFGHKLAIGEAAETAGGMLVSLDEN